MHERQGGTEALPEAVLRVDRVRKGTFVKQAEQCTALLVGKAAGERGIVREFVEIWRHFQVLHAVEGEEFVKRGVHKIT